MQEELIPFCPCVNLHLPNSVFIEKLDGWWAARPMASLQSISAFIAEATQIELSRGSHLISMKSNPYQPHVLTVLSDTHVDAGDACKARNSVFFLLNLHRRSTPFVAHKNILRKRRIADIWYNINLEISFDCFWHDLLICHNFGVLKP